LIELKFYVQLHTKQVILETFSQANLLAWYGKTEPNTTLECGPMPNLMVALPKIGGTLCSTPQSLDDAHY